MVFQNRSSDNATATRLARLPIDKSAEPWRVSWFTGLMTAAMIGGVVVFLGSVL